MTARLAPDGFFVPRFDAELDVEAHVANVPANATVKGTIVDGVLQVCRDAKVTLPTTKKYAAFRDYPMAEMVTVLAQSARLVHPDVPLAEGLRRLGQSLFPAFTQTLIGKVMYGVFGNNLASILKLANKSFEMTQNLGRVKTDVLALNVVKMTFSTTYTFLNSYHFGVIEGTLAACKLTGDVWFKQGTTPYDGDYYVAWDS